jgi:RNA ligase
MTRPPYPRVPHLAPGPGISRDDLVLSKEARERLLGGSVHIEEKLDGANMSFALCDSRVEVATRGGPGAIDRGDHLGRARAWAAERSDDLRSLLADGYILYGEWLLTRHSISYDSLPDLLVGFDLFDPKAGWIPVNDRDERLRRAGVAIPHVLGEFDDVDLDAIDELMGPSTFGAPRVEGLIVRALDLRADVPRLAKRMAEGVPRVTDEAFERVREQNRVARAVA